MCCRAWLVKWQQLGVPRNGLRGDSPSTSLLCASGQARICLTSLRPATNRVIGRITVSVSESLLGDDPTEIINALTVAARDGASPADLGRALAYAAALRVARFGTANEHSDWETAHHVFTYANAVHQALKQIGSGTPNPSEAVRALLHDAMALYLARYLNVPPASLPGG